MKTKDLMATTLMVGVGLYSALPAFAQYDAVQTRTTTVTSTSAADPLDGTTTITKRTVVTPSVPQTVIVPASATIVTDGVNALVDSTGGTIMVRKEVVLPTTTTYVMVDPLTGAERGIYNPATGLTSFPAGVVLADRSTNRVVAMVDNGRLVEVTSLPTVAGSHVILRNGVYTYLDEVEYKISVMERNIDDEYKAGRLSASQVADLKQKLNEVSSMKTRYTRNGGLTDSKMKTLVQKLDVVASRKEKYVAVINGKRANIGIRVD